MMWPTSPARPRRSSPRRASWYRRPTRARRTPNATRPRSRSTRTRCSRIATLGWCSNSTATRRRRPDGFTRIFHLRTLIAVVAAALVFAAPPARAQEPFRQNVVVTAAASPVELETVTRTLTVITREQIARLPVHSIADVLRLTAAVDVRARGERGVQTDFAVRGANFGQMLVLVDGVRLNDAQSGHHNGDIPVPLDAVERIEILHGSGSSIFGADAFGGTVNIITRKAVQSASAVVETGSFG